MQIGSVVSVTVAASHIIRCSFIVGCVFLFSCGAEPEPPPPRAHAPGCVAPEGVSNQPTTIEQTVALVNALPKPLTLPCFVESLARPLHLHASQSEFSAQPALGARSPRVFIFIGENVMTVVPAGMGSHLLELGEQRPDFRSLKAEIEFPVLAEVTPQAPFEQVMFNEQLTNCAFCHAAEVVEANIGATRAFVSEALRPLPRLRVPLVGLAREHQLCEATAEPERCALLDALFGWGRPEEQEFPPGMPTFE